VSAEGSSEEPIVDVVLPTRGAAPYLDEALRSVVDQTFARWRLTISENGPGDAELAAALAPYLGDARIRHVVRGVDLGMSGNHSAGVAEATAPYVGILHDDDRWDDGFLERRVGFLDRHEECALVFGRFTTIDEDGRPLATKEPPLREGVHAGEAFVPIMLRSNVVGMPSLLVRKSAYDAVGPFADGFPMIDYEMWIRIGARFPIGFLDVDDSQWRFHGRQRSARVQRWGEAWLRFYDAVEATVADVPLLPQDREHLRRQRAASLICACLDSLEAADAAAARRYLEEAVRLRPASVVDPRVVVAAAALKLGRPGASAATRLRAATKHARRVGGPVLARAKGDLRGRVDDARRRRRRP
jgi:Glycosyl transferase family 2